MPVRVVLYIAMSADGFIAKSDGNLDWLSVVEKPGEDYGYYEFIKTVDVVIMGRKTYDKVCSFGIDFPHKNKKCFVWSGSRTGSDDNVTYFSGNPADLLQSLNSEKETTVFVDGGAEMVKELMRQNLIDRYIVSVIPYFTGGGIRLFGDSGLDTSISLVRSATFPSGLVQLWYDRK